MLMARTSSILRCSAIRARTQETPVPTTPSVQAPVVFEGVSHTTPQAVHSQAIRSMLRTAHPGAAYWMTSQTISTKDSIFPILV